MCCVCLCAKTPCKVRFATRLITGLLVARVLVYTALDSTGRA